MAILGEENPQARWQILRTHGYRHSTLVRTPHPVPKTTFKSKLLRSMRLPSSLFSASGVVMTITDMELILL
jgi:hypothetical protein